jgi:pyruvate/2-oxoglutarate dehydrogenase complex dihydrolipoamide acyltransferase (E2) component
LSNDDIHILHIKMPSILDSTDGKVTKWLRKVGESVAPGRSVCRVQLDDMEIEIQSPVHGVLADILANEYVTVPHDHEVCIICDSQDAYMTYIEERRVNALEAARAAELEARTAANIEEAEAEAAAIELERKEAEDVANMADTETVTSLLRALKRLQREMPSAEVNHIVFMQKLARQGDVELLRVYRASYDSDDMDPTTFDAAWFLEAASDIVKEKKR